MRAENTRFQGWFFENFSGGIAPRPSYWGGATAPLPGPYPPRRFAPLRLARDLRSLHCRPPKYFTSAPPNRNLPLHPWPLVTGGLCLCLCSLFCMIQTLTVQRTTKLHSCTGKTVASMRKRWQRLCKRVGMMTTSYCSVLLNSCTNK